MNKDMKYSLEQDGDILKDSRDKVLLQQTLLGEEIISIKQISMGINQISMVTMWWNGMVIQRVNKC